MSRQGGVISQAGCGFTVQLLTVQHCRARDSSLELSAVKMRARDTSRDYRAARPRTTAADTEEHRQLHLTLVAHPGCYKIGVTPFLA